MKRFVIDGNKVIINKPSLEHKVDDFEVEENEVYGIDIVMSTGEGKVCIVPTSRYDRILVTNAIDI